jgi:two-component system sensor histidine kinase VanS
VTAGIDESPSKPRRRGLRHRGSARLRLTATFSVVLTVVGLSIVASVFLVMRFVPDYRITALRTSSAGPGDPASPMASWAPSADANVVIGETPPVAEALPVADPAELPAAVTISGESDVLRVLLTTSSIVFVVALVVGVWLSWVVAGRLLRPVEHLATAAREAEHGAAGSFRQRLAALAPGRPDDEFGRLATTFDDMLDRLDRAYEAQRRFAANASHELRTPLATTQAMLDAALALDSTGHGDAAGSPPTVTTRRLREMNARSIATVEALLTLSDAQSGEDVAAEAVDLVAVVDEVLAATASAATEARVEVRCAARPAQVTGDRALLSVLVGNLVRNGIGHNVPGGRLDVTVGTDASGAPTLHVANGGEVVDPAEVARLTEPFYRPAGRVAGSHGLGLALVAAVAETHGATLTLDAPPSGGLAVRVVFPVPAAGR